MPRINECCSYSTCRWKFLKNWYMTGMKACTGATEILNPDRERERPPPRAITSIEHLEPGLQKSANTLTASPNLLRPACGTAPRSTFTTASMISDTILDGRNCERVIAESLARVTAAIRIASVRWRSNLPPETQKLVLTDPAFVVLRFESRDWRSFV